MPAGGAARRPPMRVTGSCHGQTIVRPLLRLKASGVQKLAGWLRYQA
jgi:hypothetical protein